MRASVVVAVCLALGACADATPPVPGFALAAQSLDLEWALGPHRVSLAELRALPPTADATPWSFAVQQNGGTFGPIDRYAARMGYALLSAPGLRALHGSTTIAVAGDRTAQASTVTVDVGDAPADAVLVPVLRGFRISTLDYETPPEWIDRYDPARGFTSMGLGIRLHEAQRSAGEASFEISASVRHAPCNTPAAQGEDMNGVIPLATTWVTVEHTLLVVPRGKLTTGSHEYFVSYPDFAKRGIHAVQPTPAERRQLLAGQPGLPVALVALQGFDLLANDPEDKDPACEVLQRPECDGPGRYLRVVRAAIAAQSYDPATGVAEVEHQHLFTNDSPDATKLLEQGNMCSRVRGYAALLQLPEGTVSEHRLERADLRSGDRLSEPLDLCTQLPAATPCP